MRKLRIYDVTIITIFTDVSRCKGNQTTKFCQLIEYSEIL